MLKFDFERAANGNGVVLTRYLGDEKRVEVPAVLDGSPVTAIGSYAFAESGIRILDLPWTVERMGRYALYHCAELEIFSFCSSLTDIGAGSFSGCHRIRTVRIEVDERETSRLRDVLMEIPEELELEYLCGGRMARLVFPEYYEEGVENTPARIIESHMHGSGILYRNCFVDRKLQFAEYDRRFSYALGQERPAFLFRLCMARLTSPYRLQPENREVYEAYLKEHFSEAVDYYTARKDQEAVSFLMQLHRQGRAFGRRKFTL